jgi:hypothetical protein
MKVISRDPIPNVARATKAVTAILNLNEMDMYISLRNPSARLSTPSKIVVPWWSNYIGPVPGWDRPDSGIATVYINTDQHPLSVRKLGT